MEENKLLNNNNIEHEKQKLQQEIRRLKIYNNCDKCSKEQFLCYFPNKTTEIHKCFDEDGCVTNTKALQNIIMEELCSLLYPCIEEGCIVKQVDDNVCNVNKQNLICLQTPEDDKYIGISIERQSKMVVIDGIYCDENNKKRFFPNEGIQINHYY